MKKFTLLFSFLLFCTLAFSQSIFLDAGPSVQTDDTRGQPVLSYSFGLADADGSYHDISLVLVTGIMSPALLSAAASGTYYSKMEIKIYDNATKVSYRITLHNVLVSAIQSGQNLMDNVTLSFDKVKIKDFNH
jgi:type VI protein secretion system component Hcp